MVHLTEVLQGGPSRVGIKFPAPYSPYPPEYNARVHGPYDPARYYGKPKISFWDVKLGNMGQFLQAADKSPKNMIDAVARFGHRYARRHIRPQKAGITPFYQILVISALLHYTIQFKGYQNERRFKYHW